jgi:hypothetical protein
LGGYHNIQHHVGREIDGCKTSKKIKNSEAKKKRTKEEEQTLVGEYTTDVCNYTYILILSSVNTNTSSKEQ